MLFILKCYHFNTLYRHILAWNCTAIVLKHRDGYANRVWSKWQGSSWHNEVCKSCLTHWRADGHRHSQEKPPNYPKWVKGDKVCKMENNNRKLQGLSWMTASLLGKILHSTKQTNIKIGKKCMITSHLTGLAAKKSTMPNIIIIVSMVNHLIA